MITKLSYFINASLKKQINHTVCHHNINSVSNSLYRIQKIFKKKSKQVNQFQFKQFQTNSRKFQIAKYQL